MGNEIQNKKTRIKLRVDTESNWMKSTKPLLEGEIGISYEPVFDRDNKVYDKKNFKIKIGKCINNHCFLWKDSPNLSVSEISSELKTEIKNQVLAEIGDEFLTTEEFNEFKTALEYELSQIQKRLSQRVTAFVTGNILTLSEGMKPTE